MAVDGEERSGGWDGGCEEYKLALLRRAIAKSIDGEVQRWKNLPAISPPFRRE